MSLLSGSHPQNITFATPMSCPISNVAKGSTGKTRLGIQGLLSTLDLSQDISALPFPLVGFRVQVPFDQVTLYVVDQLPYTGETAFPKDIRSVSLVVVGSGADFPDS